MADVCAVDGVGVSRSRSGRLIHTDALPKEVDPDHEVVLAQSDALRVAAEERFDLRRAAEDMYAHHAALHPSAGCEWASRLEAALR